MKHLLHLAPILASIAGAIHLTAAEFQFRHHFIDRDLPGASWAQTALVDVDKDGRLDYITGQTRGPIFWYRQVSFDRWERHKLGDNSPSDVGGKALDVDGDGWVDFIAGGAWYRNTGKPRTESFERIVFDKDLAAVHDLVIADVDGDGRSDVLTLSDKNNLRWYRIPNDPRQPWERRDIGPSVHAGIGVGDIDGDGDLDVARSNLWFENADGKGTRWVIHENIPFGNPNKPYPLATHCAVLDLDRDGDNDLVMTENEIKAGRIGWLENLDGKGGGWKLYELPKSDAPARGAYHSLIVADFDNDGDADIFSCEMEGIPGDKSPRWFIWENRDGKGGTFTEHVILDANLGGHLAVAGDVDGDGDLDIVGKLWRARKDNANGGRNHVDLLENLLVTRSAAATLSATGVKAESAAETKTVEVPRWQPRDFPFTANVSERNPFQVSFAAAVRGPDGNTLNLPGFYDGNNTWKIRVSPIIEGQWSLVTKSDVPELNGQRAEFTCVANPNPAVHGGLRVDSRHPYHFVYEDGTRYFLMGYECDWLWALDANDPELKTVNPFLDKLAAHGFNYLILNSYAHDTGWRKGRTGADDYGPPPLYAWAGSNDRPDPMRFNLAYWQHYDRVMDALHRRGITAHMLIKVYNKMVKWPARGSAEDDLFFRWLIARYAAYPNVVWDFSKEAHNEKDLDYKLGRFGFIRENDPYRRLVTNHDDDKANDSGAYDELNDYRADQHHSKWREKILQQRQRRAWPVVNVEFGYEHGPGGPGDKTYGVVQPPEEVVRRAWEISLAGGYTAYYYTYTAWDVIRPQDTPPGYAYFKNLRAFFESTRYWELSPADKLVSAGWCLANPGKEYVVFLNKAEPFTLNVAGASGALNAEWYHPLTGQRADAGALGNGEHRLTPPGAWGDGPAGMHVRNAPQTR